ncbi:MAG: tRNA uracil 4-sulfurtransferase ThiI [Rhodospirillaceae bacterium]
MDSQDLDESIIILRLSPELMLKSTPVRRQFQDILRRNLRFILKREGVSHSIDMTRGRVTLMVPKAQEARALDLLPKVFGIGTFSVVERIVAADLDTIRDNCLDLFRDRIIGKTFAVRAKRMGPRTISTRAIEVETGAVLGLHAKVDLTDPDVTVRIEVIGQEAHLYLDRKDGAGGLPAGTQGRVAVLVSGGFDSMVAAWQIIRRGASVEFVFCNLGGAAYERQVVQVVKVLTHLWAGGLRPHLHVVDFQGILAEIKEKTPTRFWQIVLKREMYRVAEAVAAETHAQAIVTGEALGQVSSQTLSNLNTIDAATSLPVLRPLIGFDKKDIVAIARRIGTAPLSERIPEFCGISEGSPAVRSNRDKVAFLEGHMDPAAREAAIAGRKVINLDKLTAADLRAPYLWVDALPETAELIDCQPDPYYRAWHVPDVRHYTVDDMDRLYADLPKTGTYILYCAHGVQSALMVEHMQQKGYDAYAFRGGLTSLQRELERLGRSVPA